MNTSNSNKPNAPLKVCTCDKVGHETWCAAFDPLRAAYDKIQSSQLKMIHEQKVEIERLSIELSDEKHRNNFLIDYLRSKISVLLLENKKLKESLNVSTDSTK